ncbi:MAG: alanine racemase [Desulfobacterales bacterium]|nr:alanine racemase [Desulfobacterales bacterium]
MILKKDSISGLYPQSRIEVDLGALAHNITALKGLTSDTTRFMAVVKANAYGHGAVQVAKTALENGADYLAVVRISEAVALREAGITEPLLLLGEVLPEQIPYLANHDIRASISNVETARAASAYAAEKNLTLKAHIKMDTGMGRLGFVHDHLLDNGTEQPLIEELASIFHLGGLEVEGLYTHLASADEADKTFTQGQVSRFAKVIDILAEKGLRPKICHAANSAGLIDLPASHFDMVRPGIALYGLWPSQDVDKTRLNLKPVMSIKSKVIQVKSVPKGFGVSYGSTHVTNNPTTIATVPIGYADGYSRLLSNKGHMLVRGKKAPVVGRVTMDFTMIDVGHIPEVIPGDEVVVLGSQGNQCILADDIAKLTGTINYEVTAGLTGRMPISYRE